MAFAWSVASIDLRVFSLSANQQWQRSVTGRCTWVLCFYWLFDGSALSDQGTTFMVYEIQYDKARHAI